MHTPIRHALAAINWVRAAIDLSLILGGLFLLVGGGLIGFVIGQLAAR